jgi:hypothetical protein
MLLTLKRLLEAGIIGERGAAAAVSRGKGARPSSHETWQRSASGLVTLMLDALG